MAVHQESDETYGAPKIHAELVAQGIRVGRKRVARLMREAGVAGVSRRKKARTTRRDADARPALDLVDPDFTATAPDQLWVADITYIPTWAGFLYLAVVLDAFSRRIVSWSMATRLRTRDEARMVVFRFIEGWHNPRCRHASLGYLSPVAFEAQYEAGDDELQAA